MNGNLPPLQGLKWPYCKSKLKKSIEQVSVEAVTEPDEDLDIVNEHYRKKEK